MKININRRVEIGKLPDAWNSFVKENIEEKRKMSLNNVRRNNARLADAVSMSLVSVVISILSNADINLNEPIKRFVRYCKIPIPACDIPMISITNLVSPMTILGLAILQPDVRVLEVLLATGLINHVSDHDILLTICHSCYRVYECMLIRFPVLMLNKLLYVPREAEEYHVRLLARVHFH